MLVAGVVRAVKTDQSLVPLCPLRSVVLAHSGCLSGGSRSPKGAARPR